MRPLLELQQPRAVNLCLDDADVVKFSEELALGKMEIPTTMDILREDDVWICDTGASNHSTNSDAGARNRKDTNSSSVGHVGPAVKEIGRAHV